MDITLRKVLVAVGIIVGAYAGWRVSRYFFSTARPHVEVTGLVEGNYYSGNIACAVTAESGYKLRNMRIFLDGAQVLSEIKKKSSSYNQPFVLNTRALAHGAHVLKVDVCDATRNCNCQTMAITFNVDNVPLRVAFARPDNEFKVSQGRVFHVPLCVNKPLKRATLTLCSKEFAAIPESEHALVYECFVPIECEEKPGDYPCTLVCEDFVGNKTELSATMQVVAFPFKRQVLHHIDASKFEEERKLGRPERELSDLLVQVSAHSPKTKVWRGPFYTPLNSNWVTCDFGAKRVSQERGCYTHAAVDMVGPMPRAVVWAPQDGTVVVKDRFEVTGNTVVIDHGCGIVTMLCHLDQFADIQVGDKIRRGRPVGVTGKTGYATGDHLHWEMRLNNIPVDPLQWTHTDF